MTIKTDFPKTAISRRKFLISGSLTLGSLAIGSKQAAASDPRFIETSCGSGGLKILVAYASLCGTTSGVAKTIGDTLCEQGARVDIARIRNVTDPAAYDAAVIGSAVKSGAWHADAIEFVKQHRETFSKIPVAYFLTCLALARETPQARQLARAYFEPVLTAVPDVAPRVSRAFAGVLDYEKLPFFYRPVMRSKMKKKGIPEGDFRDLGAIRAWTASDVWPRLQPA